MYHYCTLCIYSAKIIPPPKHVIDDQDDLSEDSDDFYRLRERVYMSWSTAADKFGFPREPADSEKAEFRGHEWEYEYSNKRWLRTTGYY